jgi:hypothetical protein
MATTVAELYRQYLGRRPDAGGLSFWEEAIKGGPTTGIDQEEIDAFIASARSAGETVRNPSVRTKTPEQQVSDLYYQYLNRAPDAEGLAFWSQQIQGGPTLGLDPEEITAFLQGAQANQETPAYSASVTTRPVVQASPEESFMFSQAPAYQPPEQQGDKTFEGRKYFEADKQNILKQLQAQQAAGMKYTASFTSDEGKILDDLATRLAANGVTSLTDLKQIMSGPTTRDTGEGQIEQVESAQIGLYNSKTGEPVDLKMLTNSEGKGTTNYQAVFVNGMPVFTANKAATGIDQIKQDFGPILLTAALAIGVPALGPQIGSAINTGLNLGLSVDAATAVGKAIYAGTVTGAITEDATKAIIAAATAGTFSYLNDTGALGDIFDKAGLSEYKEPFGIKTVGSDVGSLMEAEYARADQLFTPGDSSQVGGLTFSESVQNAQANRFGTAGDQATFSGIDESSRLAGGTEAGMFGNVGTSGFGTALTDAGTVTTGLQNAGFSTGTAQNLAGATAGGTGATGLLGGATAEQVAVVGGGATVVDKIKDKVEEKVKEAINDVKDGKTGDVVTGLVNRGIDYATAVKIADDLRASAGDIQRQATAVGQASQVPFTPYTLTTGTGTATIGPSGATTAAAPGYEALRQQQLALSGQAFGAVNPAQAAQTLYGQIEALAAPGRTREQLALQERLQRQGLLGFGANLPTTGGGVRAVNPLFESLLSAQETARAQQALQAQQFGTTEAGRLQQLGAGFLTGAQNIDQQTLANLSAARGLSQDQLNLALTNAERQRLSSLEGLRISTPLLLGGAEIQAGSQSLVGQTLKDVVNKYILD